MKSLPTDADSPAPDDAILFDVGDVHIHRSLCTPAQLHRVADALIKHQRGEWGEIPDVDRRANNQSLQQGGRWEWGEIPDVDRRANNQSLQQGGRFVSRKRGESSVAVGFWIVTNSIQTQTIVFPEPKEHPHVTHRRIDV